MFGHSEVQNLRDFASTYNIEHIILSDTSGKFPESQLMNLSAGKLVSMEKLPSLPFRISYTTPDTLGRDRIAAAAGAFSHFKNQNRTVLIIDMGTCITMDILKGGNNFLGGNISPGIRMRIKAMHYYTGKLPEVPVKMPDTEIGYSTVTALQNGAVRGACMEIESFIQWTKNKFGKINVLLTGGDAPLFADFSKNKIFALPNLVLDGLNLILKHNVAQI